MTMNSRSDGWTAAWVARRIPIENGVVAVNVTSGNTIEVNRNGGKTVQVLTLALETISAPELRSLVGENQVDFVVNVPSGSKFEEDVLTIAKDMRFAIGGMGDLLRALDLDDPTTYVPPQARFILRGLQQHSAVESVERIGTNRYRLKGRHWPLLVMIDLNDYELTAEALRQALDEQAFDFVVASNPNRGPTSAAIEVAKFAGKRLFVWKELLAALNKPWN